MIRCNHLTTQIGGLWRNNTDTAAKTIVVKASGTSTHAYYYNYYFYNYCYCYNFYYVNHYYY